MPLAKLAALAKQMAEITDHYVATADGKIIKYIGDASLLIFHEETIDASIQLMIQLKKELDNHLGSFDEAMTVTFSLSYGEIIFAQLKPLNTLDVFGQAVNQAALLNNPTYRGQFVLSEAVMERASEKTKALFRESRPPATYIAN
jgi:class 3 adenylate cyclase